jgi:TonB family protein
MAEPTTTRGLEGVTETANERLKRSWNDRVWGSTIAAIAVHFLVLQGWPTMTAAEMSLEVTEIETLELPEVDLPPPPEEIRRPAAPVIAQGDVSADVTIEAMDWEAPTAAPPPPAAVADESGASGAGFTPYTVAPTITNRDDVARALDREYPQILKNSGIGGTVQVAFHIDETGRVLETRVDGSSGYDAFDEAAERVAEVMRFTPAMNRENAVAVWVTFSIVFEVR